MGEVIKFPTKEPNPTPTGEYDRQFEAKVVRDALSIGDPSVQADAADFRRMLIAIKNTKQT